MIEERFTSLQEAFFNLQEQIQKDAEEVNSLRIASMALPFLIKDKETFNEIVCSITDELIGDGPKGEESHILCIVGGALLNYVPGIYK